MSRLPAISTLAALAALTAAPALAQQRPASPAVPGASTSAAPPAVAPPAGADGTGAAAGRLQQTHGGWRSSRIVGATVYSDNNQDIGTIDDLIVGQDGKVSTAVISVGGFLGIGSKLVGVPYDQLRFEERKPSETAAATNAPSGGTAPTPAATPGAGATAGVLGGAATSAPGAALGTATTPGSVVDSAPSPTAATAAGTSGPGMPTTRIVLPSASKDSLTAAPSFNYVP